jgi:murein L,D-transpeptidase YcbB/YkuD
MLRENPYVLMERGIDLRVNGRSIDPGKVDWNNITKSEFAQVKMIQAPGDDNPLGKVRVIMDNPYNIYLHDTNNRELFDKKERALSSGCIRVAHPEKLAEFLFSKNEDMTPEKLSKMIHSGRMRDVPTAESIPVFITYQTIWLDSNGRLVYGRDVYGQDANLAKILEKEGLFHMPSVLKNI